MKILLLSDDFPPESFGGAGMVAYSNAKKLHDLGNDISVITIVSDKIKEGLVVYEGIRIFKIYSDYHERWRAYLSLYNPQVVEKIKKILISEKPDIVHAHNIHKYISYYSLLIAKKNSRAVFLTAHDAMSFAYGKVISESKLSYWEIFKSAKLRFNPLRNIIVKNILKRSVNKVFAVSESLKRTLINNGIKNIEVVWNGIDIDEWVTTPKEVKIFEDHLGIPTDKKVVLFGGRLSGMKGGRATIDAFNIVVKKNPQTILLVVGNKNQYAEKMINYAEELGIEKNIIFTGWISRDKMKFVFGLSDVVVVASLYADPLVIINLEAMACSKPIVGTIFGGTKELVEDEATGYIVDPNNTEILAGRIIELLQNEEKSELFGVAGRKRVEKFFTEDIQIKKILFWYNKFLNKKNE